MSDVRLDGLADILVGHSTRVREGDVVLIEGPTFAAPLFAAVFRRVLERGGNPLPRPTLQGELENLLAYGTDAQLDWLSPVRVDEIEGVDVRIGFYATWNTKSLTSVDPARQARFSRARRPLSDRTLERAARGELRWVLSAYPALAAAQDAAMSLEEYEEFVYTAAFLDRDDPVGEWRRFAERIESVAAFLRARSELRIVAEDTDLTLGVSGRTWMASSGQENFPDGETFTGPVEDATEGTIRFTYPAVFQGREVHDVRLRFEAGRIVEATAARGQDFLDGMIGMDEGARRVGEFAFGLNDAVSVFTRNILFDEKIGGTVHLALGQAYPETGGLNKSALHWDMICDLRQGGEVYADGELVYRGGRFLDGVL